MKNLFLALALMLVGSFAFANVESKEKLTEENLTIEIVVSDKEDLVAVKESKLLNLQQSFNDLDEESCTMTSGSQIISNGEVIYQESNVFHIDGYSCEEIFALLASVMTAMMNM